jgi:predicted component of type VI protein secretion system
MRMTETQIRQVIRKELETILNEGEGNNKVALAIAAALGISYLAALTYIQEHHEVANSINKVITQASNDLRGAMGKKPVDYKLGK